MAGGAAPLDTIQRADEWIARECGGLEGEAIAATVLERYGDDRSFAAPILAACAAAGLLGEGRRAWRLVPQLPLPAATLPHRLLRWVRLPVVSYALPALIAIGYVRHRRLPSSNPLRRWMNSLVSGRVLARLEHIQPLDGGFLEAVPLTAFVALSLVVAGRGNLPVVDKASSFLASQAREDGSWAIDADLAVWVTSLSVAALGRWRRWQPAGSSAKPSLSNRPRRPGAGWLIGSSGRYTPIPQPRLADGRGRTFPAACPTPTILPGRSWLCRRWAAQTPQRPAQWRPGQPGWQACRTATAGCPHSVAAGDGWPSTAAEPT
jgi:hypothetical protein